MLKTVFSFVRKVFTTTYNPQPSLRTFLNRAQTQQDSAATVTVAVPDSLESKKIFGVTLERQGIQAVYLKVENRGDATLRLQVLSIDPNYFTPLEAAMACHFSLLKRFSALGLFTWMVFPMLMFLMPLKIITAILANHRIDDCFRSLAFRLRPIEPGACAEGFVFTRLDAGTKMVPISLFSMGRSTYELVSDLEKSPQHSTNTKPIVSFNFSIPVPGIAVDYHRCDFQTIVPADTVIECGEVANLMDRLKSMPATTSNRKGTGRGDPVNLVVIGEFETLISAFASRWDETESITLATCWKTMRSFLIGSEYRYSPVSPLYLFGRSQDIALQRSRRSIDERLHLRLWLTNLRIKGFPVWIGQISRDIGVRFTTKAWNLTTHKIDPDVDEARDYVVEDLLEAERLEAAGYVGGVNPNSPNDPGRNLTGDPYFTDGKRAVVLASAVATKPRFMTWS